MSKNRLNLDDLKVQSFVTTIDPKEQAAMYGRVETGPRVCPSAACDTSATCDYSCDIEQTNQYCYDTEQIHGCGGDTSSTDMWTCDTEYYDCDRDTIYR